MKAWCIVAVVSAGLILACGNVSKPLSMEDLAATRTAQIETHERLQSTAEAGPQARKATRVAEEYAECLRKNGKPRCESQKSEIYATAEVVDDEMMTPSFMRTPTPVPPISIVTPEPTCSPSNFAVAKRYRDVVSENLPKAVRLLDEFETLLGQGVHDQMVEAFQNLWPVNYSIGASSSDIENSDRIAIQHVPELERIKVLESALDWRGFESVVYDGYRGDAEGLWILLSNHGQSPSSELRGHMRIKVFEGRQYLNLYIKEFNADPPCGVEPISRNGV